MSPPPLLDTVVSVLGSCDWGVGGRGGAGRVRTLQRRQGQQKQWLLDSEWVFLQRINLGELMLGNLGPGAAGPSLRAG